MISHYGKEYGKEYTHIGIAESLRCVAEINTTLQISVLNDPPSAADH